MLIQKFIKYKLALAYLFEVILVAFMFFHNGYREAIVLLVQSYPGRFVLCALTIIILNIVNYLYRKGRFQKILLVLLLCSITLGFSFISYVTYVCLQLTKSLKMLFDLLLRRN